MRTPVTAVIGTVILWFVAALRFAGSASPQSRAPVGAAAKVTLHDRRLSASDLEIGGDLAGLPHGSTRYLTRDDLLALPQVRYAVTGDTNFIGPTQIGGVPLEKLGALFGASPASVLVVAICDDQYRANYPPTYLAVHHPTLVLTINGQPPERWPKDAEGHNQDMGPYMISHPNFMSRFKILAHEEEPQIPWGVVRLEFRSEKTVLGAIAASGPHASDPAVQAGFRIAQQNCFRCHNQGA